MKAKILKLLELAAIYIEDGAYNTGLENVRQATALIERGIAERGVLIERALNAGIANSKRKGKRK